MPFAFWPLTRWRRRAPAIPVCPWAPPTSAAIFERFDALEKKLEARDKERDGAEAREGQWAAAEEGIAARERTLEASLKQLRADQARVWNVLDERSR